MRKGKIEEDNIIAGLFGGSMAFGISILVRTATGNWNVGAGVCFVSGPFLVAACGIGYYYGMKWFKSFENRDRTDG
jgi:hypothetical protein